jgi:phosphoglycerate dehydrogenase-like enzyme
MNPGRSPETNPPFKIKIMLNVLVDMPVYAPLLDQLKSMDGIQVKIVDKPEEKTRSLPAEMISDCDVLFCTFPPDNHSRISGLKMIQLSSAGYEQVIGQGFGGRKVNVCNARGVFDIMIAEWNMAMMINIARDLRSLIRNQDSHIWDRAARFQHEIRGSVVGIWGYGGIGRETARLAKALGLTVHVLTRNGIRPRENVYSVPGTGDPDGRLPDRVFSADEKEEFLKGLDFLILAIPLTRSTRGIVGESELNMLDPKAFLLNPARGALIQEEALMRALREGWLAGAALDTHFYEPMPPDHPLWDMPNVIMTPHISGSSGSPRFLERVWEIFMRNMESYRKGGKLLNELTASQLEGTG